ncbi:S9 family peptidase [Streptomyces sp. SID14478]|uniref:S9 family peptidase n=1 Tax=Streptomyces sp. SID14478 TaxID=2706073 RepID=UPI0013DD0435|nr:S9 family peptidase [Streptomyces sp. SID14478]NEB77393.1 S9 family peptidase [Streptomyces sp. SID14478]
MSTGPRTTPSLSVDDFLGSPVRAGASISPDGSTLAYLAPRDGHLNVWLENVDGPPRPRCVAADAHRSVHTYHWTNDPRWLLYEQDGDGDEKWHLFRVDLENPDAEAVDLTPFPSATAFGFEMAPTRPGKATLWINHRDPAQFDLCELDIAEGRLTTLAQNPGQVMGWLHTPAGELYAQIRTADGDVELAEWHPEKGATRRVTTFPGADYPMGIQPARLTPDGTGVWLGSHRDGDRTRLIRLDLATGEETEVDAHPAFDLDTRSTVFPALPSALICHRGSGELLGVRYLGERQVIRPLDPGFAAVLKNLEKLSDGDVSALSSDTSGERWVVSFTNDRDPGLTYYYDHTTGTSRLLFRPYPHLGPEVLAPMAPVTIPARDGLQLPSYLTLPLGQAPTALPTVLLVHGGPWTRDSWGYNPLVQLLAHRGYAVLQVNFRGSTGYGKTFLKAGIGELAGKMHDDLLDAVDWAVENGFTDRDRVAIFGGSYGGYAALVGASFTPDVFAAAIDICGISNLVTFLRTLPPFTRPHLISNWYLFAGDPADPEQEADLLARSPISRVHDVRAPLLVIQGSNDVRVVKAESDQIVDALRNRGVEVEYMVKDDEGHGFVNPQNIIDAYRAADTFLARHLHAETDPQ